MKFEVAAPTEEPVLGPSQRNLLLSMLSALLAVFAVALAVLSPTQQDDGRIHWDSRVDPATVRVSFIDPVEVVEVTGAGLVRSVEPSSISTVLPGDAIQPGQFALRVLISNEGVQGELISSDGSIQGTDRLEIGGLSGGFPDDWTLRLSKLGLELGTGTKSVQPIALPPGAIIAFSGVHQDGIPIETTVHASASGLNSSAVTTTHTVLLSLSIILVLLSVLLSAPVKPYQRLRRVFSVHIHKSDVFVLAVIVFSAFVSRTTYDDGWVLQRARLLAEHWSPSALLIDPYQRTPMPQGFVYESLLAASAAHTNLVVGMRIVTVVLSFALWIVVSRTILPRLGLHERSSLMWVAAAYISLWSLGWMTLRAEIPVAVLSAILLSLGLSASSQSVVPRLVGILGVTGLGVATHQSGLILIPAAVVLLVPLMRNKGATPVLKITGILGGLALALIAGFTNQNLDIALRSLSSYGGGLNIFDQWERFSDMFRIGTVTQRAWFLAGIVGVLALWIYVIRKILDTEGWHPRHWVFAAAATMPLGILFTSSKWHYHFSALVVPMLLGLLIVVTALTLPTVRRSGLAGLTVLGFTLLIGISIKDSEFDSHLTSPIVFATLVFALLIMLLPTSRKSNAARLTALTISSTILLGAVTLWNALDLALRSENNWSFLAQATSGVLDPGLRCGMVTQIASLPEPGASTMVSEALAPSLVTKLEPSLVLMNPCFAPPGIQSGQWLPQTGFALEFLDVPPEQEPGRHCADFPRPVSGTYSVCLRELATYPQLIGPAT